jgi:predicted permease
VHATVRFALFLLAIYGFLFFGYATRRVLHAGQLDSTRWSGLLSRYFLLFTAPVIILNSLWSVRIGSVRAASLPLLLTALQVLAVPPALLIANRLKAGREEKGAILACSVFSNTGPTLGMFLCFVILGDRGLYLSGLSITLYTPVYYLVGFPLISLFSPGSRMSVGDAFLALVKNPVAVVPISAMVIGLLLNLGGVPRPDLLNLIVTRYMTYVSVAGFSFAIGLGLDFQRSVRYLRHAFSVASIKFVYTPLTALCLLALFGYLRASDLLPARVIVLESAMPTAIMAVIMVKVFGLDEDMANAAWILTTILVIPLIPLLFLMLGRIT